MEKSGIISYQGSNHIIIIIMYSIYIAPFLLDSLIIKGAFSLSRCDIHITVYLTSYS